MFGRRKYLTSLHPVAMELAKKKKAAKFVQKIVERSAAMDKPIPLIQLFAHGNHLPRIRAVIKFAKEMRMLIIANMTVLPVETGNAKREKIPKYVPLIAADFVVTEYVNVVKASTIRKKHNALWIAGMSVVTERATWEKIRRLVRLIVPQRRAATAFVGVVKILKHARSIVALPAETIYAKAEKIGRRVW